MFHIIRKILIFLFLVLIAVLVAIKMNIISFDAVAPLFGVKEEQPVDKEDLFGPYPVVRVVDGDTAIIRIEGIEKRCRYISINTEESVADPSYKENTEIGRKASEYAKKLLTGKSVYIEYDVQTEDDYGRTLVYLYMEMDGKLVMINEYLVAEGIAQVMTVQPNVKYADRIVEAQKQARKDKKGFWADEWADQP